MLHNTSLERLKRDKNSGLFGPFLCYEEIEVFVNTVCGVHSTSFSSELMNGSNKIQCYIILGWKDFPWTNTLAYWEHFQAKKKGSLVNTKHFNNTSSSL